MHNYAETWKVICSYNLVYNLFVIAFAIAKFRFFDALFKCILKWEQGISKS